MLNYFSYKSPSCIQNINLTIFVKLILDNFTRVFLTRREKARENIVSKKNTMKIDKNEILKCHFENEIEIDQSLIELLLINQRPKFLLSDEHKLVQTLNFESD